MNDQPQPPEGKPPEGTGSKSLQAMKAGGSLQAIYPQTFDEVYRFAQVAVRCGLLKPISRRVKNATGKWEDETEDLDATVARGSMIVAQGLEIGMPPMRALQTIALIGTRLCVHSEGIPAVLWSKRFHIAEWWIDGNGKHHDTAGTLGDPNTWSDGVAAFCRITRPDGAIIVRSFSVQQAKTAKLWDRRAKVMRGYGTDRKEVDNDSTWYRFPDRMLPARARGFASKDGAPDALSGMGIAEEAIDMQRMQDERDIDLRAVEAATVPAIPFDIDLSLEPATPTQPAPAEVPTAESIEDLEVVLDDEQVLSRAAEAKLIMEVGIQLATATTREKIGEIERGFMPFANRISDDGRDTIIDAAETARKRITEEGL